MYQMLCRNRVENYTRWKAIFDSHASAHRAAGLELTDLWRDVSDPNDVFFLFAVSYVTRARAFLEDPAAAEAGRDAGVVEGEIHLLERGDVY
jgi:hypothetical protein